MNYTNILVKSILFYFERLCQWLQDGQNTFFSMFSVFQYMQFFGPLCELYIFISPLL